MDFTYEQEIVDRARRLSADINEYFEEQKYKKFTDEYQQEEITDRYLLNVAIELLISELKDMGIESDLSADDIIEDHTQLETLFALRTKFDKRYLTETLQHFSFKTFAEFQMVYEGIELPEDLFLELGPWFSSIFPSDPMWTLVSYATNTWYSTEYFGDHLSEIMTTLLDKCDTNHAIVTDGNIDSVARFLKVMEIRASQLRVYVRKLVAEYNLDADKLDYYIDTYDQQKLNNESLPLFAAYNDLHPAEEPEFVKQHHLNVNHHVEYWVDKAKRSKEYDIPLPVYTKEIAVMIVLSYVLDNLSGTSMRDKIKPLESIISRELYEFTKALTFLDYKSMMRE